MCVRWPHTVEITDISGSLSKMAYIILGESPIMQSYVTRLLANGTESLAPPSPRGAATAGAAPSVLDFTPDQQL